MILAPSDIHFLKDVSAGLLGPDPETMADLRTRFQEGQERIPKVQVASKDGLWFALNNSYLHIIRDLQRQGKCSRVLVEVVPLTKVPTCVQKGMVVGKEDFTIWADGVTRQAPGRNSVDNALRLCQNSKQNKISSSERSTSKSENAGCDERTRDTCRMSRDCLSGKSLLDALATDTDASSSYSSTDYSDYDNDDDDDEDEDDDSDSEYDDAFTWSCNVCRSSFPSARLLARHQQKMRHFGCRVCRTVFSKHRDLERHCIELDHWSTSEELGEDDEYESESDDELFSVASNSSSTENEEEESKSLLQHHSP